MNIIVNDSFSVLACGGKKNHLKLAPKTEDTPKISLKERFQPEHHTRRRLLWQ